MTDKKMLRRTVLEKRESLGQAEREAGSKAICLGVIEQLKEIALEGHFHRGVLAAYLPFGHEANIEPVLEWCWREGIRVVVPRTENATRRLHFHHITSFHEMKPGVWGIREPEPDALPLADMQELACILIPGVAFDAAKGRLGYGGGFYDRFMEQVRASGAQPVTIAAAFDLQIVSRVPMDAHDLRVDRIVTESGTIT